MWKILFVSLLVLAFAGATKFELKGRPRQRLKSSLEEECEKYSHISKAEKTYNGVMTAVACLYNTKEINDAFEKFHNINSSETMIDAARALCSNRRKIVSCYYVLLTAMEPCAPPAVRSQIDTMQASLEQLAEYVCEDDCKNLRDFVTDGGYDCVLEKDDDLSRCSANVTDLTTEVPEDTTTFAAIDACYRYDAMVSCMNDVLKSCPKPTTLEMLNNILSQFRRGTYCHVTLPLHKDEDETSELNQDTVEEDNKL